MSRLAIAVIRYRRQRNEALQELVTTRRELSEARAVNHRLSITLRQMDATNAVLSAQSVAADMRPVGRFET